MMSLANKPSIDKTLLRNEVRYPETGCGWPGALKELEAYTARNDLFLGGCTWSIVHGSVNPIGLD